MDNNNLNIALARAVIDRDLSLVISLVTQGADVHHGFDLPLRYAASQNDIGIAEYLLKNAGANVHAHTEDPLRGAISGQHLGMVKLLLSYGANPLAEKNGENLLMMSIRIANVEIFETLINATSPDHKSLNDLLIYAGAEGQVSISKVLIKRGADIFHGSYAALSCAMAQSHAGFVQYAESIINAEKASFIAEMEAQTDLKKWLRQNYRQTDEVPLIRACKMGLFDIVAEKMIAAGDALTLDDLSNFKEHAGDQDLLASAGANQQLKNMMNPKLWQYRLTDMQQAWSRVPEIVKKMQKVDMPMIVAEAQLEQLKRITKKPVIIIRPKP